MSERNFAVATRPLCSKSRNQIFIIQLFFSNFFDFFLTFSDNFWQYFDFFGPFWPVLVPGTHPDRPGRPGNFDLWAAGLKRTIPSRFRATFCLFWGSTAHPLGMQVRVLNRWAAARRSRPLSSRPPLDLLSTSPRPPLDLPSTSPRPPLVR